MRTAREESKKTLPVIIAMIEKGRSTVKETPSPRKISLKENFMGRGLCRKNGKAISRNGTRYNDNEGQMREDDKLTANRNRKE